MALVIPQFNRIQMETENGVLLISQSNGARDEDHKEVDDVIEIPLMFLNEFVKGIHMIRCEKE